MNDEPLETEVRRAFRLATLLTVLLIGLKVFDILPMGWAVAFAPLGGTLMYYMGVYTAVFMRNWLDK